MSALVAVTLTTYTVLELRASETERRLQIEQAAKGVALTARAGVEALGLENVLARSQAISDEISKSTAPWRIDIVPAHLSGPPASDLAPGQVDRLNWIMKDPERHYLEKKGDTLFYVVALKVPVLSVGTDFQPVGSLEVSRNVAHLEEATRADRLQTILGLGFIAGLTILAIWGLTRSVITRPIEKLLAGIDDVARGDLSHVLLSERDDEIGALAARFNDMTQSLRESHAETDHQNQARLALEQRLGQTEKMATLGQLAAEIAHEVGTPLNVIAGRAKNLGRKAREPEAVQKNASIIAEQTARITRIIQRLLDFTRRKVGSLEPEAVDINKLSATTLELLESKLASAQVEPKLEKVADLPPVKGDPDRLQQVLLNLMLNAVQAMPEGGDLRVSTSQITRRRPGLEMAPEQKYVIVAVADSGPGIPAEKRDKIFEPFYTSKYDSGGTGLGLAVCYGIVKEHDGWIDIADAPKTGTVFSVYLPAAE